MMIFLLLPLALFADDAAKNHSGVIYGMGIAILAATVTAYIGHKLRQPLLLAYIAAGILIGPKIGLGLIGSSEEVDAISEFGLILLLFLIGLEIDIKKLKEAGKSLITTGLTQLPLTVLLGIGFFLLLGYSAGGDYSLFYLAACCALSSTAIVVKLLYGKFELDSLAGRITLGVLVFQDIWAIVLLGIQPNLSNPDILQILISFGKGFILVFASMMISKYVLHSLFRSIAKIPELILISSLGWCFLVCGAAGRLNLSVEMGALIAGIAISTFPYNLDVMAKVVNIRDFFVTLFFVSLGMKVPNPLDDMGLLAFAGIISVFLIASRFAVIFPTLYALKNGLRVSLITSINLSQISEFSLVIATLGLELGHISERTLSAIIFVFVITSVTSTYMIKFSDNIQRALSFVLKKIGLKDIGLEDCADMDACLGREIVLLGFSRYASSLLVEMMEEDEDGVSLKDKIIVIDFNPEVRGSLQTMGVKVIYGDISHPDTLHHAGIHTAKIVISTIPDPLLVGTDNLKIIKHIKEVCPDAKIIVTAESISRAMKMYMDGADFVFLPRVISAKVVRETIGIALKEDGDSKMHDHKKREMALLQIREEIVS
ncbi:MAG: cation:proton antiporter [Spirochaetia bacterium]|nr:cation:proton antiporter [Spirochaetia bacterium]